MECEEFRVDTRDRNREGHDEALRSAKLVYKFNHTEPYSEEGQNVLRELFQENLGEGSHISAPISGACISSMKIGKNVFINSGLLAMARGGITIEDEAHIAANVQLISNNHDPYDLAVLTCKPVLLKEACWIGAGATILPGVCVGKHAIVGAGSVVTKDVEDYAVVVGNPAKVIRRLDPDKFD